MPQMASFIGNRGFGSGVFRPILLVLAVCLLMFLLYAYSSTNSELKQHKDRADRLTRQQDTLKTQIKDLLDAKARREKDLQNMQVEQAKCIRDTEQLKRTYTSQIESMKETLRFRISSLENENSELQSRAGSYEEKYNELSSSRRKDQETFAATQQKCHEAKQKFEAQNAELNVQMADMQRNLDAFRLDRLRSESIRQNCSNQLAMSKMKLGQLQEEFQRMTVKLKTMGNSLDENPPAVVSKTVSMNKVDAQTQTTATHRDDFGGPADQRSSDLAKQDVMRALQGKLAQGEQLQNSEKLLYQALSKETGKVNDLQQPGQSDSPAWYHKLSEDDHKSILSKETQDLLHKMGNNIPAPPFLNDNQLNQQHSDTAVKSEDGKDVADDQNSFEKDQRNEERRLYEMFQGDNNNHVDSKYKNDDAVKEDEEKLTKEDDQYVDDDKDDDKDNNYGDNNDDDDNYVYGGQDNKVNPDQQNNALI